MLPSINVNVFSAERQSPPQSVQWMGKTVQIIYVSVKVALVGAVVVILFASAPAAALIPLVALSLAATAYTFSKIYVTGVWTKFGARERARQNGSHSERGANICNILATRRMRSNEAAAANRESNLVQSPDVTIPRTEPKENQPVTIDQIQPLEFQEVTTSPNGLDRFDRWVKSFKGWVAEPDIPEIDS